MCGSLADHDALVAALEDHDRKERIANLISAAWAYKLADRAYLALIPPARACGFQWSSNETVLQFARKRVASYRGQAQRGFA